MNNLVRAEKILPKEYFINLGKPNPKSAFDLMDRYRFQLAATKIEGKSMLDVGAYLGDLIIKVRGMGINAYGTDVNDDRVEFANHLIGENVVSKAFLDGSLADYEDQSIDTVVCTEVLEHVEDNDFAISELCRVAKKRIIISVPFEERLVNELCINCGHHTPHSGHLHSYSYSSLDQYIPENWMISNRFTFGSIWTRRLIKYFKIPNKNISVPLVSFMDRVFTKRRHWIMYILEQK